jgi:hypothetical protein
MGSSPARLNLLAIYVCDRDLSGLFVNESRAKRRTARQRYYSRRWMKYGQRSTLSSDRNAFGRR